MSRKDTLIPLKIIAHNISKSPAEYGVVPTSITDEKNVRPDGDILSYVYPSRKKRGKTPDPFHSNEAKKAE